ncbi:uncharacterized protein SAPINGB_P005150 [Magnusiomyces paraingens]|uniref:Uncharacterized protein n=1 Tax=Magnusiomyces paraingens TaxID=2606893 RepID=A0A5E8C432_9ASCO|nr:uncharacterized protein SAPINGB_P005150 [Saprochaete ingens]VVT56558.1 unnamed protein product [Saprochaete ingens]
MTAAAAASQLLVKYASDISTIFIRDVITNTTATDSDDSTASIDACSSDNDYDGRMGARISAIFVILVAGTFGALFPVVSSSVPRLHIPPIIFFMAKYFGSGVIVATSLIHLLQPANENLTDECLGEGWSVYPYAYGIALGSLFGTFFVELISRRYLEKRGIEHTHGDTGFEAHGHSHDHTVPGTSNDIEASPSHVHTHDNNTDPSQDDTEEKIGSGLDSSRYKETQYYDGYTDSDAESAKERNLAMQLGSIFILEFGIIFHSVFIGLSLAVSGSEFTSLYIVLVFHQMFEGLGLGTRIAVAPWPERKKWLPWALGIAYGFTTPIAIAIGLGVRESYPPGSSRALITNGIFDAISAGILLYVGLVELVGNEFMHNDEVRKGSTKMVIFAYFCMMAGAGLMALLGRWA